MWKEIEALTVGQKLTVVHRLLIQSINKVFEVHEDRISAALALSFSMVLFLIADLDRPTSGLVQPDQTMMIELGERFQQLEK